MLLYCLLGHRTPPATLCRLLLQAITNMHHWKAMRSTSWHAEV